MAGGECGLSSEDHKYLTLAATGSLSSGESEFYALLRAAVEAKFLRNLWCWLEFEEPQDPPEIVSGSSCAIGCWQEDEALGHPVVVHPAGGEREEDRTEEVQGD